MQDEPVPRSIKTRFKILKTLGGSLMGRSLLAEDRASGQKVVLKELELAKAEDWKEFDLFERGAKALESLDHPQIPAFYESFYDEDDSRFYLVQEHIEGVDLKQKLASDGPMSEEELVEFLASMLDLLDYLHGFSPPVLHRDIKPSNIMQRSDKSFVLIDFDAVQTRAPDKVGGSTVVGTTGFMPPEQLVGRAQPASDLFALGATAIQLCSGEEPMNLEFGPTGFEFEPKFPLKRPLKAFLKRMADPRLDMRFQNVGQAQDALLAATRSYELAPSTRQNLTSYADALKYNRLMRAQLDGDTLQITLLSRPSTLVWKIAGMMSLLLFVSALILLSLAIPLWVQGLIGAAALVASFYTSTRLFQDSDYDTGITQILTLTAETISLREKKTLDLFNHRNREPKRWTIPREDLRGVYFSVLDDADLPRGRQLWRQALQNENLSQDGLIFEDNERRRHIVGEDLLRQLSAPKYKQRLEAMRHATALARAYLDDAALHDDAKPERPKENPRQTAAHKAAPQKAPAK